MNNAEKEVLRQALKSEKDVLKALEKQYETAMEEIDDKIASLLGRNDANLPNVIHQVQYQRLIKEQIRAALDRLHAGEYETIGKYLQDSYTNGFVGTMYSLHQQGVPVIVPIDQDAAIKAVTIDSQLKEPLYESLGVDVTKLKKSIATEITRGIAAGQTYAEMAQGIRLMTKAPLSRARTIVRTEAGRVQEQANFDAANKAKAAGADVVKQWSAVLDGKTRDSHRKLDHQIRELDKPFEIDGKKAMYPHDFGDPAEDCNCRCTQLTRARAALDEDELNVMQKRSAFFGLDKTEDFEDFKKKYLKAAESVENAGESGIIDLGNHVPGFKAIQGKHGISDDIGTKQNPTCNPNFSTGQWGYVNNCQRCVQAYEFRRRGYNVIATERPKRNNKIIWGFECFTDANGNPVRLVHGQTALMINKVLARAPDGSRYTIYVKWKGQGAHVFIAEKENGVVRYLDPQNGNMDATDYFNKGSSFGYFRMDDKQLTTDQTVINATMEEKKDD